MAKPRIISHASELTEPDRLCACCERPLKGKVAWLELDQRTDTYHDLGGVPERAEMPNASENALRLSSAYRAACVEATRNHDPAEAVYCADMAERFARDAEYYAKAEAR